MPPKMETVSRPNPKSTKPANSEIDPDFMFKAGFLKDVYDEIHTDSVVTRFPPEPNGYLHIGHAKAITVNFGFARFHHGKCYLRYDDTNPEAEEEKYFDSILEMIRWLGFEPYEITYSSDRFDKLYELAEELIRRDGAYICHCTDEDIKRNRGDRKLEKPKACPHRDRPTEESLAEFRAMKAGKYKPKEAILRMKQDLTSGNPQMWDMVAYRVLDKPHHRTGDKWKIYPTYDFTHCICDKLEDITHSLCTVEFETARESYDWLLRELDLEGPKQREYSRLNVTGTIMSKRKINKLIAANIVFDHDDPRLYTLIALRRRGIPPGAILAFVNELGVSKAPSNIQTVRFERCVRDYLELKAPRLMLVLDPVPVIIDNVPDDFVEEVTLPFAPKNPAVGSHVVPFTKTIYIERSDFREEDSPDFIRLAPGKTVGLLNGTPKPFLIKATSFKKNERGEVTEIHAELEKPAGGAPAKKSKTRIGSIHWVGESKKHNSPLRAEVRVFNALFKSESPDAAEGGFLNDINEGSLEIFPNAAVEVGLTEIARRAPWPEEAGEKGIEREHGAGKDTSGLPTVPEKSGAESVRFQGMRVAYFCMDKDSKPEKIVLNRIVSLKEDVGKGA